MKTTRPISPATISLGLRVTAEQGTKRVKVAGRDSATLPNGTMKIYTGIESGDFFGKDGMDHFLVVMVMVNGKKGERGKDGELNSKFIFYISSYPIPSHPLSSPSSPNPNFSNSLLLHPMACGLWLVACGFLIRGLSILQNFPILQN